MAAESISKLTQDLPQDPDARQEIYLAARKLMLQTETPRDAYQRIFYPNVAASIAHVAIEMGVFRLLAAEPNREWQAQELVSRTEAELAFIVRIMRALSSYDMVAQLGPTTYKANATTTYLAEDGAEAISNMMLVFNGPTLRALPSYMQSLRYQNPTPTGRTAWSQGANTEQSILEYLGEHPDMRSIVFNYMRFQRTGQVSWMVQPAIMKRIDFTLSAKNLEQNRPLFVDLGGSSGHQCLALRETNPHLKGTIILQDLAMMTAMAGANPRLKDLDITVQTHDFTTPETTEASGAKVFYSRNVFHDWTDEKNAGILKHVKDVMAPDSVMIIDDMVVPEVNCSAKTSDFDILMMAIPAAIERTEAMWKTLIEDKAGMRIREILCYDPETSDSLIVVSKE